MVLSVLTTGRSLGERLGTRAGALLAPVVAWASSVRRARMFHPEGVLYRASIEPVAASDDLRALGDRLAGRALVRLSSAWWRRHREWPDVLGMALRFTTSQDPVRSPDARDQDLLFATIRFPWTTLLAPATTEVSSFLWNHFHAVSPFVVDGVGRVKFRLESPRLHNSSGVPRIEHLARAVADEEAIWRLQARRLDEPPIRRTWEDVALVVLEGPLLFDQQALRFSPFRSGRGVRPVGFIHHMRVAAYAAGQRARDRAQAKQILVRPIARA
jgi:hypothetical protein